MSWGGGFSVIKRFKALHLGSPLGEVIASCNELIFILRISTSSSLCCRSLDNLSLSCCNARLFWVNMVTCCRSSLIFVCFCDASCLICLTSLLFFSSSCFNVTKILKIYTPSVVVYSIFLQIIEFT